ncbi:MAG: SufD family Fe-S cluster assembly protein [Bacillales bacterium]|nr:SufD family Fe-S cluster assembly protein [Bacillales bacterium]
MIKNIFPSEEKTISLSEVYRIEKSGDYTFKIEKCIEASLFIFVDLKEEKVSLNFSLLPYSNLSLTIVTNTVSSEIEYNINLEKESKLLFYSSDYTEKDLKTVKTISLSGYHSSAKVYEVTSAKEEGNIKGAFNFNHNNSSTECEGDFYYLANGNTSINKDVVALIKHGMKDSVSGEKIKGILLSKNAKIEAKPILKIEYDEVKASHGCAIGTIDANEIYYLMSRGLTKEDAMKIISKSFINPIILMASKNEEYKELVLPYLLKTIGSDKHEL